MEQKLGLDTQAWYSESVKRFIQKAIVKVSEGDRIDFFANL
ncbi:MAG: hypothetical protein CM15mP102_12280 [Flavobacteriales bacterium]|nr:MAG: hypothetical protein CM15mP102_12280 [Flavobacteriales bacterium]